MRTIAATAVLLALTAAVAEQGGGQREGGHSLRRRSRHHRNIRKKHSKEALASVLKAIGEQQFDYLLAHLADPAFADQRVSVLADQLGPDLKENQKQLTAFGRLVRSTAEGFREDPSKFRDLKHFQSEGEWTESSATIAEVSPQALLPARRVAFMKASLPLGPLGADG